MAYMNWHIDKIESLENGSVGITVKYTGGGYGAIFAGPIASEHRIIVTKHDLATFGELVDTACPGRKWDDIPLAPNGWRYICGTDGLPLASFGSPYMENEENYVGDIRIFNGLMIVKF